MARGQQKTWDGRRLQQDNDRTREDLAATRRSVPSGSQVAVVGQCVLFASNAQPPDERWKQALGGELSRSDYPEAFEAFQEIHGAGNGSTTFNLPNLGAAAPANTTYFVYVGRE